MVAIAPQRMTFSGSLQVCLLSGASMPWIRILVLLILIVSPSVTKALPAMLVASAEYGCVHQINVKTDKIIVGPKGEKNSKIRNSLSVLQRQQIESVDENSKTRFFIQTVSPNVCLGVGWVPFRPSGSKHKFHLQSTMRDLVATLLLRSMPIYSFVLRIDLSKRPPKKGKQ